jgi:hypothetical protein
MGPDRSVPEVLLEAIATAAPPSSVLEGSVAIGVRAQHHESWLTIKLGGLVELRRSASLDSAVDAVLVLPGAVAESIIKAGRVGLATRGLEVAGDRALLARVLESLEWRRAAAGRVS